MIFAHLIVYLLPAFLCWHFINTEQAVLHISVMQSFFFGKGHEPARCEKLRKETTRLRSQILQYDATVSFDLGGGGQRGGVEGSGKSSGAKKLGDYCIACELARLFDDMFSTEGKRPFYFSSFSTVS